VSVNPEDIRALANDITHAIAPLCEGKPLAEVVGALAFVLWNSAYMAEGSPEQIKPAMAQLMELTEASARRIRRARTAPHQTH
jgi:hypothetical protein